jgi:photosystem II stability/assembly factor-like uncharacterized protein
MRFLPLLFTPLLLSAQPFDRLEWRFVGPANMGGRTTDVEGVAANPNIVYVGTGGGGLWKTTNGGVSWTPIFERQGAYSIGDIALEPNNPEVIWVGTGESNPRNSVSFGDGVYKSTDGGKTWMHLGLKETRHISRVLVHPQNPEIVYVGALGHIFGPHTERGVFLTTDGGRTWSKTLYIDDRHGVADMDIDPVNPNILYSVMWEFERKPWMHRSGGEKGGIFRSVDGGKTWKKLTAGLPKLMGRAGVKVSASRPNVVYVVAESKEGTLFRSDDRGDTFRTVSSDRNIPGRGFYYADIRVDPADENRVYALTSNLRLSTDGGRTFRTIARNVHLDFHAMWIDPKNPDRQWVGQDGGIAVSYDRGVNWEAVQNIPLGQFYQIHADNRQPFYHIVGGLQDNGTWSGPSRTREPGGILNDDWIMVSYGDGFYATTHPDDPDLFLTESQGGSLMLTNMRTREQQSVSPQVRGLGGPASFQKHRFNWNSPIEPSPHEKNTVYVGGNMLFRTQDFGRSWKPISPDLTKSEGDKQKDAGGPLYYENTTAEYHGTIISVSESPARPGTIWAGADDGNLQRTTNGGESWTNLTANLPAPPHSPVSHIEASRTGPDTAYIAFDRHMFDDARSYIFKTTDGGKTYTSLSDGLPPNAYVHVVKEDPKNSNLLYAGTELGLFVSFNAGKQWQRLHLKNLPHVAVHDIVIHQREHDLILGTHGRSVVILDDSTFLRQWSDAIAASEAHLFDLRPALRHATKNTRMFLGEKAYTGPNPPYGAVITYYLKDSAKELKIEILDSAGKVIRTVRTPPKEKGVNRVVWDLRMQGPTPRRPPDEEEAGRQRLFGGGARGPQVLPGSYRVGLTVNGKNYEKPVTVQLDPALKLAATDLTQQFELLVKVQSMISKTNETLKSLDSLKEQTANIEKVAKDRLPDAAPALSKTLAGIKDQIDKWLIQIQREPDVTKPSERPGFAGRLTGIFFSADGANAAPTPAVLEALVESEADYNRVLQQVAAGLAAQLPQWNETLRKAGAPVLVR